MTTEEMIEQNTRPLFMELEYAEEARTRNVEESPDEATRIEEPRSKKEQIIALYESGVTDVAQIVRGIAARPSYVAQDVHSAGLIPGYFDLYTTAAREQTAYTRI